MPSHAPLSSRDGRIRSSSIHQQGSEPFYYSNEDIQLLHQVVSLGQEILPTLPKRDKLPTTALFRAADIVFPRYGLDPDGEDKLSRVIFMVGGMRSTDNLLDRFRTVLGRMGIELEYVPEPNDSDNGSEDIHHFYHQPRTHPSPPLLHSAVPPSVHSAAPSPVGGKTAHSGNFPLTRHVNSRRRRNSDTVAELVAAAGANRHRRDQDHQQQEIRQHRLPSSRQHHRRRSNSLARPLLSYQKQSYESDRARKPLVPLRVPLHTSRPIAPWLSQIPHHSTSGEKIEEALGRDAVHEVEDVRNDEDERDDYDNENDISSADEYTRSLQMLRRPQQQHLENNNLQLNANHRDMMKAHNVSHLSHNHNYQNRQSLPYRTRPFSRPLPHPHLLDGRPDAQMQSYNSSMQPAGSWTEPQSPQSPQSRMSSLATDYEEFQIPSDTTMQEELEGGPPPKVDPIVMAKVADTYFMRFTFLGGLAIDAWKSICEAHQEQERCAVQLDRELSLSEALVMWSDAAHIHADDLARKTDQLQLPAAEQYIENETEHSNDELENDASIVDDDEVADQFRQVQEERERLMRRAARVYSITTLFNAINHWQSMTQEEASRTRVARRHLLRKKVFFAWREQTAIDNVKVTSLTLGWAAQRWNIVLHQVQEENEKFAVQFYHRDLVTVKFWTWFRAHQEQTAASWAIDRIKKQAIEGWCKSIIDTASAEDKANAMSRRSLLATAAGHWIEQTQNQALTLLRIEDQENETYMRAAIQDWAKESFCQTQLRAFQAANETSTKETVLELWRQGAAEAQHRAAELDLDITEEYAAHWHRETHLALFRADYEHDLKADAVHSWILAEKLAFYLRYRDEQLIRKTCFVIKLAFGNGLGDGEQKREDELARTAERLYKANALSGFVSAFREQSEERTIQLETAEFVDQADLATGALEAWTEAMTTSNEMADLARRGAFYVGVANSIDGWPAHARNVREERLRTTYRSFRRKVKRQAATECVAVWGHAVSSHGDEALGNGGYGIADHLRIEYDTQTIFTTLNNWILETNDRLFQQSVASEADTEVYLSRWRLGLAFYEELSAASAEHDTVMQLAGRWGDWELQAVQTRARKHTAEALHEKNDRRLGRRVLAIWQHQLADQLYLSGSIGPEDLRASYASTSTISQWPGEGGRTRNFGGSTNSLGRDLSVSSPFVGGSEAPLYPAYATPYATPSHANEEERSELKRGKNNNPFPSGSKPGFLHPIAESPVTTTAQRPFYGRGFQGARNSSGDSGIGGSYSVPVPGTTAEAQQSLLAPMNAGQLRQLHRSNSAVSGHQYHQYGQQPRQQRQPQQQQQQQSPFRSSTVPTSSAATSATVTPGRESHRHRLLQRRLQSAARLADSVQLGPMSEFDEQEALENLGTAADVAENVDAEGDDDLGLGHYADVSSEGDDDGGSRGGGNVLLAPHRHRLLSSSRTANTPTRFHPDSEPHATQPQTVNFARPSGGMSQSVSNAGTLAIRQRPSHGLRKSAVAASASGARALFRSSLDAITTTPMGPLPSPFERRLRAAYGEGRGTEEEENERDEVYEEEETRHLPLSATPLRRLPLRNSTMSTATGGTARTGARVTFADMINGPGAN